MTPPAERPVTLSPLAGSAATPQSAATRPALAIRIDRVVLDGVAVDSREFRAALHEELHRILSRASGPGIGTGGALSSLRVRDVALPATASGRSLGESLARALHAGLWP